MTTEKSVTVLLVAGVITFVGALAVACYRAEVRSQETHDIFKACVTAGHLPSLCSNRLHVDQ